MATTNGHGGKRKGAGRPKGSRGRRSEALADKLIAQGKCPVDALVRLAERAESEGDLGQAIGAWKSVLPYIYIYPRPKAVEIEPEEFVELTRSVAEARMTAVKEGVGEPYNVLMQRIEAELARDGQL